MKILKPGKRPFTHIRIICPECECEFIASKDNEVILNSYNEWKVTCPCCEEELSLEECETEDCYEDGDTKQKFYEIWVEK